MLIQINQLSYDRIQTAPIKLKKFKTCPIILMEFDI